VAELAAGIALHGLGLAVARKVVGTTALVAGGRARATTKSAAAAAVATEAATHRRSATAHVDAGSVLAGPGQVTGLAAVVAAAVGGTGTGQAEGRAVSLDVAEALAVVALLGVGGTG